MGNNPIPVARQAIFTEIRAVENAGKLHNRQAF
jgi:hypothetical protein